MLFENEEIITLNELSGVESDKEKTVKIILKHGGEIIVKCKDFSVTKSAGLVMGYEISGIRNCDYPMYIDKGQIAAILYVKEGENI